LHGISQRREIRTLAVTTRNQNDLAFNTVDSRQGCADVGPL